MDKSNEHNWKEARWAWELQSQVRVPRLGINSTTMSCPAFWLFSSANGKMPKKTEKNCVMQKPDGRISVEVRQQSVTKNPCKKSVAISVCFAPLNPFLFVKFSRMFKSLFEFNHTLNINIWIIKAGIIELPFYEIYHYKTQIHQAYVKHSMYSTCRPNRCQIIN